jgi:hypothetical protein
MWPTVVGETCATLLVWKGDVVRPTCGSKRALGAVITGTLSSLAASTVIKFSHFGLSLRLELPEDDDGGFRMYTVRSIIGLSCFLRSLFSALN